MSDSPAAWHTITDGNANELLQELLAARPEVAKATASFVHEKFLEAQTSVIEYNRLVSAYDYARDFHSVLLMHMADSKLDLSDSTNIPQSTVTAIKHIVRTQHKIPMRFPLPLVWPARPDSRRAIPKIPSLLDLPKCVDHSDSSDDSSDEPRHASDENGTSLDDLVHRLAVSSDPNFEYRPDLYNASTNPKTLPGRRPWSHKILYRVDYEEATITDGFRKTLAQKGLKLPNIVLNFGRLVATSTRTDNPDGSNWSVSDYAVMVDIQAEDKPVWLLCDSHVVGQVRSLNRTDGTPGDVEMVHSLFDWRVMDMALLFPRINDWESSDNTWPALEARISETAVKLGLHLRNL